MKNSSKPSTPDSVDKEHLYGEYLRQARWRDSVQRQSVRKALDLPDDDMHVQANRTYGVGWKELAVLAALLGGLAVYLRTADDGTAPTQTPANQTNVESAHDYEIRFYDSEGNPVRVDQYQQPLGPVLEPPAATPPHQGPGPAAQSSLASPPAHSLPARAGASADVPDAPHPARRPLQPVPTIRHVPTALRY